MFGRRNSIQPPGWLTAFSLVYSENSKTNMEWKNVKTAFGEERGINEFEAVRNAGEDKMARLLRRLARLTELWSMKYKLKQ